MQKSLGAEIKRLADIRGLATQQAIADATGLSRSFVTRLLADQRPQLTAQVLYQLCDGLGVSCEHFRPFLPFNDAALPPDPNPAQQPPTPPDEQPKGKRK